MAPCKFHVDALGSFLHNRIALGPGGHKGQLVHDGPHREDHFYQNPQKKLEQESHH